VRKKDLEVNEMTSWKKGVISFVLVLGLITLGSTVFAQQPQGQPTTKDFEGTVKAALGKYLYLPETKGLDIIVAGNVEGGVESLVGKEVRVKTSVLPDKSNLLLAESMEIKEGGAYRLIYTRSGEPDFSDYLDQHVRDEYAALNITDLKKPEDWAGKTKIKVYGQLVDSSIVITDKKGKEIAKIVVDKMTDYARFYMKKLRLFDKFWFYVNVKEQMDKKTMAKTKEIMKGDVVFCGLF
jgi:hypothetical protein